MKKHVLIYITLLLLIVSPIIAFTQTCTALGQNPTTAFPVCGTTKFVQNSVALCGNKVIPTPCNDGGGYSDKNPYWYKFTCYVSGKLGFVITPANLSDDYDWELFDITGANPMDVFTNKSLIVSANWSGTYGVTGAGTTGKNAFECASVPSALVPTFSVMPDIIAGHEYLLLVSHFDDTQSGYALSFQGGTASIVNPIIPVLNNAYAVCDGTQIVVSLNKRMNCNSLAADGSDFTVAGTIPNSIKSAVGKGCSVSFDTDSAILTLNTILSPGTYTVTSALGTDGNTLIDNCGNLLAVGLQRSLIFTPSVPTPMDSIKPIICAKDTLELVFNKPMNCSSIESDGSDFFITGPSAVTVIGARGICSNGISKTIQVILSKPIKINGNYQIHLKNGNDGNSLIDECDMITPAGSVLGFTVKNVAVANFNYSVQPGCKLDTVLLSHNANNGTTQWKWQVGNVFTSTIQNPNLITKSFGLQHTTLIISNGFCIDSSSVDINIPDQTVKAGFTILDTICSTDTLIVIDQSTSNAIRWKWNYGDGQISYLQNPPGKNYQVLTRKNQFDFSLTVQNQFNCSDSLLKTITVLPSCYIDIPTAFTPNGDGLNDYLYPLNALKAINLSFKVFNRYGQVIFETNNWNKKWDGRISGQLQPSGTYVWTLDYTHKDTGKVFALKGTVVLIR